MHEIGFVILPSILLLLAHACQWTPCAEVTDCDKDERLGGSDYAVARLLSRFCRRTRSECNFGHDGFRFCSAVSTSCECLIPALPKATGGKKSVTGEIFSIQRSLKFSI